MRVGGGGGGIGVCVCVLFPGGGACVVSLRGRRGCGAFREFALWVPRGFHAVGEFLLEVSFSGAHGAAGCGVFLREWCFGGFELC